MVVVICSLFVDYLKTRNNKDFFAHGLCLLNHKLYICSLEKIEANTQMVYDTDMGLVNSRTTEP